MRRNQSTSLNAQGHRTARCAIFTDNDKVRRLFLIPKLNHLGNVCLHVHKLSRGRSIFDDSCRYTALTPASTLEAHGLLTDDRWPLHQHQATLEAHDLTPEPMTADIPFDSEEERYTAAFQSFVERAEYVCRHLPPATATPTMTTTPKPTTTTSTTTLSLAHAIDTYGTPHLISPYHTTLI